MIEENQIEEKQTEETLEVDLKPSQPSCMPAQDIHSLPYQ